MTNISVNQARTHLIENINSQVKRGKKYPVRKLPGEILEAQSRINAMLHALDGQCGHCQHVRPSRNHNTINLGCNAELSPLELNMSSDPLINTQVGVNCTRYTPLT